MNPISIKLRCASWQQLAAIYKRDLARSAIYLKTGNPPAIGTPVRIDLTLPSDSMVVLNGAISKHIVDGEMEGRGAGVDVRLQPIPQSAMWLIETALASAQAKEAREAARASGNTPAPVPARATTAPPAPSMSDGNDLAVAETELIVALTSELDSLKRLNSFQVLGLGYDASDLDVRTAFGELTKKYHPDRYARFQSADLRNLAAEIFILIRDAYRKLFDQPGRAAVIAVATGAKPKVMVPPLAPAAPAADPRVMAESMLDNGKYDEALAFYKVLLKKNPNDRIAKAGAELAEGMRALSARDRLEAAQRFETVLELDPANERAARELADMRRVATNERKGMLSRLLGKKE